MTCVLKCSYIKKTNPLEYNTEFELKQTINNLHNYYRFSFEIDQFPKRVLSDLVAHDSKGYTRDYIFVSITGHANHIGNNFNVYKYYSLRDVIFDEYVPHPTIEKRTRFGQNHDIIKWDELHKRTERKEDRIAQRSAIIEEIKNIIRPS